MDLENIGKFVLNNIPSTAELQAEVYLTHSVHTSVSVLDQRIEEIKNTEETGFSLRVISKGKMGFAYSSDISEKAILNTIHKALENQQHNAQDSYWNIANTSYPLEAEELNIFDTNLKILSIKDKIHLAMQLESAAHQYDSRIKKTEQATYFDSISKVQLINSAGLNFNYAATSCGGMVDVIAEDKNQMESGGEMDFVVHLKDFNPQKVGREAAHHACQMLGATIPNTQKCSLVFSPEVGIQFLALLSRLFLASSVQKGKSLLANKLGQTIAATQVTLIDNGLIPSHLGTAPFDGEGIISQKKVLVTNGVLQQYLYNIYTANKDHTQSTGNAQRINYQSLPEIVPSNFYLEPGKITKEEIIKKVVQGVYVTKVMGMHTANPISGDFSIGIAGLEINNGHITHPLRGGAIAGNLINLLKSIEEIGNDLRFLPFNGNIGSPTILISNISVSGK
ncbi:MAG: TldD/PmbA family protein [Candidatus Margulisbacteria bacterium]|nr:TldD/PmbA family protein [Candidatus Margulisiibacteriota bacterium]